MIAPDKSKGQHFLVDEQAVADLVAAGQVETGDRVVEIGPGTGVVTAALLARGAHVLAMELDRRFGPGLASLQREHSASLEVEWGNALTISRRPRTPYKVVASLPYNISARFFRVFLWTDPVPSRVAVLVQAEVAERVCAAPGKMSLLSLAVQLRATPTIARYVERSSFSPPPQVRSAILAMDTRPKPIAGSDTLWRIARIGFASRRKQLKNNLAGGMGVTVAEASDWLEAAGLSVQARAQELSLEDWVRLAGEVKSSSR